jgi:hypothetical protein
VIALYHRIRPIHATAQHEPRQQQQQNLFVAEPQYQLAARVRVLDLHCEAAADTSSIW